VAALAVVDGAKTVNMAASRAICFIVMSFRYLDGNSMAEFLKKYIKFREFIFLHHCTKKFLCMAI
jgi:hypothetical protein